MASQGVYITIPTETGIRSPLDNEDHTYSVISRDGSTATYLMLYCFITNANDTILYKIIAIQLQVTESVSSSIK